MESIHQQFKEMNVQIEIVASHFHFGKNTCIN